jgi:hypothetical protein
VRCRAIDVTVSLASSPILVPASRWVAVHRRSERSTGGFEMEWDTTRGCFVPRDDAGYENDLAELGRRVADDLHGRRESGHDAARKDAE